MKLGPLFNFPHSCLLCVDNDDDADDNNKSNWIFPLKTTDCASLMMRWHKARCLCGKWILQVDLFRTYTYSNDKSNCERYCDMAQRCASATPKKKKKRTTIPCKQMLRKHCVNLRLQPYLCKIYLKWKRKRLSAIYTKNENNDSCFIFYCLLF